MNEREAHDSIVVIDLRHERGDLLRVLLEPLGSVRVSRFAPRAEEPGAALLVIDPPPAGIGVRRWRELRRASAATPTLLLGQLPAGETASETLRALPGPLLPSRLRAIAAELLRRTPPPRLDWIHALAGALPIDEEAAAVLGRAASGHVPVLLTGEVGTGKSLVARAFLCPPGGTFHRLEVATARSLLAEAKALARGATLYLSGIEALRPPDQLDLVALIDEAPDNGLQIVLAAADGEAALAELRDDLRLRIEVVTLGFRPLRAQLDAVPELFVRALAALGIRYELEPPSLSPGIAPLLSSYPWPLNFEELIAVATRCLLAASGRVAEVEDLGLRFARRPHPRRERARPRPAPGEATRSPGSLDVLVADLAHEIKNPLVSIKTFNQLLPERFDDPEFRSEYHRIVAKDVSRIDGVLDELTQFARLREAVPEAADLVRLLRRVLEGHQAAFAKAGVEIATDLPDRPTMVDTDPELLGYALDNSLRQALSSIPEGGRLEASLSGGTRGKGAQIVFRYQTGEEPGLRSEKRGHRREVLGLRHTLAAHALAVLDARLDIEDTAEGETRITVTLPGESRGDA